MVRGWRGARWYNPRMFVRKTCQGPPWRRSSTSGTRWLCWRARWIGPYLDKESGSICKPGGGHPPLPIRLMAGLPRRLIGEARLRFRRQASDQRCGREFPQIAPAKISEDGPTRHICLRSRFAGRITDISRNLCPNPPPSRAGLRRFLTKSAETPQHGV